MKLLSLAALLAATLSRIGTTYADDSEGSVPNTQFTQIPNVIAQAPVWGDHAHAANQNGLGMWAYPTQQRPIVVFPWSFPG